MSANPESAKSGDARRGGRTAAPVAGPRKKKGAWRKFIPYGIGAALLLFIVTGMLPKPVAVEVTTVTRAPLTVTVLEEGKTRIRDRYVVSPPISGYLRRVPVRAGDRIAAAETLLATVVSTPSNFLDPRSRAQAEAAVQSAEAARMERSEQVESASAELELARKELVRSETLRRKGAVAVQDYDTASNRVDILMNRVNSAKFALQVAEFELAQARAALMQTEPGATSGEQPIEIRAPVDGAVLNVYEENARTVTAGTPIMEVGDPRDLEAEIELLSSDAVNVQPGAEVSIEQWGGGEPLRGRVSVVEPGAFTKISALGVEEQRVKVRVDFEELPDGLLGDRYRVEARITTWSEDDVLQLPTGALFRRGNAWMTFVVEGGRAIETRVEIGRSNGVAAQVVSGLSEGQSVILHPPDSIADGTRIKLREP